MAFALDLSSLGGALGSVGGITMGDIATQAALGLVVTGVVAGAKSDAVQNQIDPMHLFHKDGSQTVVGTAGSVKSISAAALKQLDPATQALMINQGYTVVG